VALKPLDISDFFTVVFYLKLLLVVRGRQQQTLRCSGIGFGKCVLVDFLSDIDTAGLSIGTQALTIVWHMALLVNVDPCQSPVGTFSGSRLLIQFHLVSCDTLACDFVAEH
jgi:hypothetical protein